MEFEFDEAKSQANEAKHGIDFVEAQALWTDADRIETDAPPKEGERRFLVVGTVRKKHWTAVITYRSGRVRIVSVGRSRKREIAAYEKDQR